MKNNRILSKVSLLLVVALVLSTPVNAYASKVSNYNHFIFDSDELRLTNLQGELLLDYFEPAKVNLKTETILYSPTSDLQNIRYIYTMVYDYDAVGNVLLFDFKEYEKGITLNNGKTYLYSYNENQQLSAYTLTELGRRWGNPVTYDSSYAFYYDTNNQLVSAAYAQNIGKGNASYSYNEQNQLISITYNHATDHYQKEYYYDDAGNCIEYKCGIFQNYYTYNTANQLTSLRAISYFDNGSIESDKTYLFNYDTQGNISGVSVTTLSMGKYINTYSLTVQNQYDSLNRLIARNVINPNSGFTTTYAYEYLN